MIQWLGTGSYSLYLWHWPVVVGFNYFAIALTPSSILAGLLLSVLFGHLSYVYIETVLLQSAGFSQRKKALLIIAGALIVLLLSISVRLNNGFPNRFSADLAMKIETAIQAVNHRNLRLNRCLINIEGSSPSCNYGGKNLRMLLIGDSHADAVVTAIEFVLSSPEDQVTEWAHSGCPTMQGVTVIKRPSDHCGEFVDWVLLNLQKILQISLS